MSPDTSRRRQARLALEWPVVSWLTLVWVLLWGEFSVGNILAGLVVSVAIIRVFPLPPIDFAGRVHPWRLAVLVYAFFRDLVLSSIQVARIVLRFGHQPVKSILVVPMRTRSELALMLTSEIVSLVPGSLLIEIAREDWTIQIHVLETLSLDDVEALSTATKRAQRIALQHGGSVASLQYDAPAEGIGAAQITLRVPTARVQSAMAQLSQLGTIVGQRYGIDDLQVQADTLQSQIEATQRQIAQLVERLGSTTLPAADRVVLQSRLSNARQKLAGLREGLRGTNAEARTATIYLTLTTEEIEPAAVGSSPLDNVKDVLAWEAIALLYALVVAGPFVLLGILLSLNAVAIWLATVLLDDAAHLVQAQVAGRLRPNHARAGPRYE